MAGRKPLYHTAEEMPVTCSLRVPRGLYDETQQYLGEHRLSLTEFLLDAIRLRLDTPADPRDIQVSDNGNTIVLQELQAMVDAAVEAALARERTLAPAPAAPISELSHDYNNTVIQEKDAAPPEAPEAIDAQIDQHISRLEHRIHEIQHDDNDTVIQEPIVAAAVTPPDDMRYYENTVIQEKDVAVQGDGTDTPPPSDPEARRARILAAVPLEGERGMTIRALAEQLGMQYMLVNNDMRTLRQRKHVRQVPGAQGGGYVRPR